MKVKIKTTEQLIAEGFKRDYPWWYKGLKKDPEATISDSMIRNIAGHEVEIIQLLEVERDLFQVSFAGREYQVCGWAMEKTPLHRMISKPEILLLHGKKVKYFGVGFEFPCAFEQLKTEDAIKLAKWVLKVSR